MSPAIFIYQASIVIKIDKTFVPPKFSDLTSLTEGPRSLVHFYVESLYKIGHNLLDIPSFLCQLTKMYIPAKH